MDKKRALQILREHRAVLSETYGVRKIGLFGSIVRDQLRPESDIDIVVEIETEKKQLHNFLALRRYLENQLGRPVDLGIESALKPVIRASVEEEISYA
jgi:predicted nucleotidyltransferase